MSADRAILVSAFLMVAVLASPATAAAEARVVDREVHQTTGAQIALDALAGVRQVDIDASGVTLLIEGVDDVRPVRVELAGLLGVPEDRAGGGALRLGTLAVACGIFVRVVRSLVRLGREEA